MTATPNPSTPTTTSSGPKALPAGESRGRVGCAGVLVGLLVLAAISLATTALGWIVARAMGLI